MCVCSDKVPFSEQVRWIEEIHDEKFRSGCAKETLFRWCKNNVVEAKSWAQGSAYAATADKWIQESSLPQTVKDQWLAGK